MPPFIKPNAQDVLDDVPDLEPIIEPKSSENEQPNKPFKAKIVWRNVIIMGALHLGAVYGLTLCFGTAKWQTVLTAFFLYIFSGMGITAGAHRLWSHRAYKARFPLRLLLAFLQTMALQNHIYEWSRDHRVHHKFSETDADPHNARRGFFFSHVGWLLCKKHPDVIRKGRSISMDDLLRDPIVVFQMKYYMPLALICCFIIPSFLPVFLWNETLWNGFFVCGVLRYVWALNMTWCVNSAAHYWGRHPYDKTIYPAENYFTVYGAVGEGFHNYHHTFPWDYAASELGWRYNLSTIFINFMAVLGQAYDLKQVSPEMIVKRKLRTGDIDTHGNYGLYNPLMTKESSSLHHNKTIDNNTQPQQQTSINDRDNNNIKKLI